MTGGFVPDDVAGSDCLLPYNLCVEGQLPGVSNLILFANEPRGKVNPIHPLFNEKYRPTMSSAESQSDLGTPESSPVAAPSFEDAIRDLQQIVLDLEGGTVTLDASLKRFEQGIGLLRQCYQFLDRTEQRIEQLVSLDAAGNCTLVPFDSTATADRPAKPGGAKPASRKTTRAKEAAPEVTSGESPEEPEGLGKLLF